MKKFISLLSAFALVSMIVVAPVNAAGVTIYVDETADADASDGVAPATVTTVTNLVAAAATDVYVGMALDSELTAGNTITITAPAGWTIADAASTTTDADDDGAVDGAAGVAGQVYTYTQATNDTTGGTTGVEFAIKLTSPVGDGVGSFVVGGTSGDYGAFTVGYGTGNTVTVSATVEPTLTLALANNTVALGTLSTSTVTSSTTDPTATVATNAATGFVLTIADSDGNVGLTSATASKTIAAVAPDSISGGAEGFNIEVSETTDPQGNGSVAAGFVTTTGTSALTAVPQTIASSTGANAGYVTTVDVRAAISGITPAASDYTTTLTFAATGTF